MAATWHQMKERLLSPVGTLIVSLLATLLFALWTIRHLEGQRRIFWLYYFVPIGVPFAAFVLDRVKRWSTLRWNQYAVDLPVLALSLARAVFPVPLISGHTLFLAYALLTTRSMVARVTAALVLIEVTYLKLLVWHDWVTFFGGWLVAGVAAFVLSQSSTNHGSSRQGGV